MNKKHYAELAAAIANTTPCGGLHSEYDEMALRMGELVERVANVLATTNPQFDKQGFVNACYERNRKE